MPATLATDTMLKKGMASVLVGQWHIIRVCATRETAGEPSEQCTSNKRCKISIHNEEKVVRRRSTLTPTYTVIALANYNLFQYPAFHWID